MNRLTRALAAACFALGAGLCALPAGAGEILLGAYAHGIGTKQNQEGGADGLIGYQTDKIGALWFLGKPSVHVIAAANSNVSTDFIAAGFDWRFNLTPSHRWYVRPGIGLAYTTGKTDPGNAFAPGLTPAQHDYRLHISQTRILFGDHYLFEPELAFGYQISRRWSAELSYIHLSNGEILHSGENQALDDIGIRLAYRLGGHY